METSSKRKAKELKVQISRATLSIPWIDGNIPTGSILEISGKKVVGISIRGKYHKVSDSVVQQHPEGTFGKHTQRVLLNAAIGVNNGEFSTSAVKRSAEVIKTASEPDLKKQKEDKQKEKRDRPAEFDATSSKRSDKGPTGMREEADAMGGEDKDAGRARGKRDRPAEFGAISSKRSDKGPTGMREEAGAMGGEDKDAPEKKRGSKEETDEMGGEDKDAPEAPAGSALNTDVHVQERTVAENNEQQQQEIPEQGSSAPKQNVPPPTTSGRPHTAAELNAWGMYTFWDTLVEEAKAQREPDKVMALNKQQSEFLLDYEKKRSDADRGALPPGVRDAEVADDSAREGEEKRVKENTKKDQEEVEKKIDDADVLLAKGDIVNTTAKESKTGHGNTVDMTRQLDVKVAADTDTNDHKTPGQVNVDANPTDMDAENNASANQTGKEVLSAQVIDTSDLIALDVAAKGTDSIENIVPETDTVMPDAPPDTEVDQDTEDDQDTEMGEFGPKQRSAQNKEFTKRLNVIRKANKSRGDVLGNFESRARSTRDAAAAAAEVQAQTGGDIYGFNEYMETSRRDGLVASALDPVTRMRELNAFRQLNKVSNAVTAGVLDEQELKEINDEDERAKRRQKLSNKFEAGENPYGTPIFSPDTSRGELHDAQRQIAMTITSKEAEQIRKNLTPHWDAFKLLRLNQGEAEMSTMPTRIIRSDKSTLKQGSKIRSDISQREESFGNFMFYMLHHRLDTQKSTTWGQFLSMAAALGYNDMTSSQINWMLTGNANGDLTDSVNFSRLEDGDRGALDEEVQISPNFRMKRMTTEALHEQVKGSMEPTMPYPSRSMTPSAGSVDNSIHPNGSSSIERQQQSTLSGLPSSVFNIPDPRTSKRGGEDIANVRRINVRNEKWSPSQKMQPGEKGYEPKFTTMEVPDIGVGSGDVQAEVNQASADRLLNATQLKLYAPIHPQACDRYLGVRNYKRLSVSTEQYMKDFSQHPFSDKDAEEMFAWNEYIMKLYGPTLYANVTDIAMQRSDPVFTPIVPESVADEYKELNELVKELQRFQEKAEDRADRINGGAQEERPMEKEIGKLFKSQTELNQADIRRTNAMIISFPDDKMPSSNGNEPVPINPLDPDAGGDMPGPVIPDDDPIDENDLPGAPPSDRQFTDTQNMAASMGLPQIGGLPQKDIYVPSTIKTTAHPLIGSREMDRGIVRNTGSPVGLHAAVANQSLKRKQPGTFANETNKRARMFHAFQRR